MWAESFLPRLFYERSRGLNICLRALPFPPDFTEVRPKLRLVSHSAMEDARNKADDKLKCCRAVQHGLLPCASCFATTSVSMAAPVLLAMTWIWALHVPWEHGMAWQAEQEELHTVSSDLMVRQQPWSSKKALNLQPNPIPGSRSPSRNLFPSIKSQTRRDGYK